jgi:hypothetical protein
MELFIAFCAAATIYIYVRNRVANVRRSMEREELIRELIRTAERKKRIDELYGRDDKSR